MSVFWWILGSVAFLALAVLGVGYVCYRKAFYISDAEKEKSRLTMLPPGKEYLAYHNQMLAWQQQIRSMPCEEVYITSFDGLRLRGKYYEFAPGAVTELMFHGYRGTAERDLCGGVQRAFALGHNVLIVDQRASGLSGGNVITFGILESRDCDSWVSYATRRFGENCPLILTGISMGAATVMMAAGRPQPPQVIGVLADCGYTSAREIIQSVIRTMGLPPKLSYPLVRLGAVVFGGFDPDADSPKDAMTRCKLPVIFFHGEGDDFVPCYMSRENYVNCAGPKLLYTVPGAAHGLSYCADPEGYLEAMRGFFS